VKICKPDAAQLVFRNKEENKTIYQDLLGIKERYFIFRAIKLPRWILTTLTIFISIFYQASFGLNKYFLFGLFRG
jgi:hypothetical protein